MSTTEQNETSAPKPKEEEPVVGEVSRKLECLVVHTFSFNGRCWLKGELEGAAQLRACH